ncbi:NADP-dependent oxidoreductase [Sphingosinithalassobacter sp. CS137]|uniref:NADP-dependent oxidoreductase n=1 Tax=Sphingosinithalassobacter sp. CS137 TaxID=2762748 RepID=UPI00165E3CCB|nr:NADP-dependent oxidoreductase [Sphingosinithalassobacter sp. CS137]
MADTIERGSAIDSATMRAWRIHRFGGTDAFQADTLPVPQPGQGAIRVRIRATSVNPVDYKLRSGAAPFLSEDDLPAILGRDVAGEVLEVAPGVGGVDVGDRVYGMPQFPRGSYAEQVVLEPGEWARAPKSVPIETAGAVPLAALTAWQGLFDQGGLKEGQRVLIHGGSGGVGHFAVQFAVAAGAEVFATASGEHCDFVRELGADRAIDYKAERFEEIVRDADLVFDVVGGETQQRSWAVLADGGILVSTLGEPARGVPEAEGKRGAGYMAQPDSAQLRRIADMIDAGAVRVHVAQSFALDDIAAAQQAAEKKDFVGKIAVTV